MIEVSYDVVNFVTYYICCGVLWVLIDCATYGFVAKQYPINVLNGLLLWPLEIATIIGLVSRITYEAAIEKYAQYKKHKAKK